MKYITWKISEAESLNLKLTTSSIIDLESRFKRSLFTFIDIDTYGIPTLNTMIDIAHSACLKYNHGLKKEDIMNKFDDYIDHGGSQVEFFKDVLAPLFAASGIIPTEKGEQETSGE